MPDELDPTAPDSAWLTEEMALARLQRLAPEHMSALEQLMHQGGQSCAVAPGYVKALLNRGLLKTVDDPETHQRRLCTAGCNHVWYAIPPSVPVAYQVWFDQGADTQQAGEEIPEPPDAPAHEAVPLALQTIRPVARRQPATLHWVRFTLPGIKTFTYHGKVYDLGQLLTLAGGARDEQLTRMEFVKLAPEDEAHLRAECGVCQQWFVNEYFRDRHGRERHRDRFQDPDPLEVGSGMAGPEGGAALRDITGDADERRLMQDMPLRLDRTAATLNS